MRTHTKAHHEDSPLNILTELAVEGSASLVEAQRTLLSLAQQENDIILNGFKEQIGGFIPGVAMTELVRRSLDTLLGMQQELLTNTSKQTLHWLETEKAGKADSSAHLADFAREAVETFTRAQRKLLDAIGEKGARASDGKQRDGKSATKAEVAHLAREAGSAFIEAQKRLLDVMGQQMNVNLDATSQAVKLMSSSRLMPLANLTGEGVKSFLDAQTSVFGSFVTPRKKAVSRAKQERRPKTRSKAVPV